jgi:hypothetical protein
MKFRIICEQCGKEAYLVSEETPIQETPIVVYANRDGDVFAECDCGHKKKIG